MEKYTDPIQNYFPKKKCFCYLPIPFFFSTKKETDYFFVWPNRDINRNDNSPSLTVARAAMHKLVCFGKSPVGDVSWPRAVVDFTNINILRPHTRNMYMKYFTPKYTSVISSCIDDRCDPPTASDKVFTKWRFFKEYFVDTDLDDDDVEFESFYTRRYSWIASRFD